MLVDFIVLMLNALGNGAGGTGDLLLSPEAYNPALYQAAVDIHNTAVKPITSIVLSIMAVLMLATTSTRAEGDRELGVRIIAATMFKLALVIVVVQNAVVILDGIAAVSTSLSNSIATAAIGDTASPELMLGDQLRPDVEDEGVTEQLTMIVILILPWLTVSIAGILTTVLIFIRFLQMYMLAAFASLPLAFFGHDETKGIAIGYLKGFATVALTGTVIVVAARMYTSMMAGTTLLSTYNGEITDWIGKNFGALFIAPIVLIFVIFGANGLAKRLIGEG